MLLLPTFPNLPQHVMTVALGARSYRYRRTYRARLGAWYVDIEDTAGRLIVAGRRLNGDSFPLAGVVVDFDGILFVQGPDAYLREDLGGDLREIYIEAAELGLAPDPDYVEAFV